MISRLCLVVVCTLAVVTCTVKSEFAQPSDALVTPSGIASKVLRVGLGSTHPTMVSTVRVHYTGWLPDGRVFDSSVSRGPQGQPGTPIEFPVTKVIPGWTEALQLMVVGEKRRFWIPSKLAYGDPGPGEPVWDPGSGQPPKGPLIFDIELLAIR